MKINHVHEYAIDCFIDTEKFASAYTFISIFFMRMYVGTF